MWYWLAVRPLLKYLLGAFISWLEKLSDSLSNFIYSYECISSYYSLNDTMFANFFSHSLFSLFSFPFSTQIFFCLLVFCSLTSFCHLCIWCHIWIIVEVRYIQSCFRHLWWEYSQWKGIFSFPVCVYVCLSFFSFKLIN